MLASMRVLVTGGAGFIGRYCVRYLLKNTNCHVCNLDSLTYAADLSRLSSISANPRYRFVHGSTADAELVAGVLEAFQPQVVINLAAETHVDNSIAQSRAAIASNIMGTHVLLDACRLYWRGLSPAAQRAFRFHQVSTDEVFGDFADTGEVANELSAYRPSSPYSASKAAADHLVRAWHRTYGLPVLLSTASNNYGPGQHAEKLMPMVIKRAIAGETIGLYGNGLQERDWLYVEDHIAAIMTIITGGEVGHTYVVSTGSRVTNKALVHNICALLDEFVPRDYRYAELVQYVPDRPGHDQIYATDSRSTRQLGWQPATTLPQGLRNTVHTYLREGGLLA